MGLFDAPTGGMFGTAQFGDQTPVTNIIGNYLRGLVQDMGQRFGSGTYNPTASLEQNALDPQGIQQAMNVALSTGPGAIRAYHGSPHDFDAFDASKIGSGEGAQAYGHGLYFAENPATAQAYRDALSKGYDTRPISEQMASAALEMHSGDPSQAIGYISRAVDRLSAQAQRTDLAPEVLKTIPAYQEAIQLIKGGFTPTHPGHMYEVNLNAEPDQFLNWDKPLSEQSQHVQDAAGNGVMPWPGDFGLRDVSSGKPIPIVSDGGLFYRRLSDAAGMRSDPIWQGVPPTLNRAEAASNALNQAGIPGIRYLDQGSRGAGDGTHNYVVFDPSIVQILRKYGIMGPLMGSAAVGAGYQQQ